MAATYGLHHCVDPWDYTDYPEYKTRQASIYETFVNNVENSGAQNKIKIHRDSNAEIPKFADDFFDLLTATTNPSARGRRVKF